MTTDNRQPTTDSRQPIKIRFRIRQLLIFLITGIVISSAALPLSAQNTQQNRRIQEQARDRQKLRQAQRYQRSNQHENAILILKDLYRRHPGHMQYYQELLESYLQLNRLSESQALIETQKKEDPRNPRYDIDHGSLLMKSDRKKEAVEIWQATIKANPKNVSVFTLVASAMARNRLFDEAAEVYQAAYKAHPDKHYLQKTLGDFYRQRLQYPQALLAYFDYVKKEPNSLQSVIRQVLSFRLDPVQVDELAQIMENTVRKSRNNPAIMMITAKFYQKHQRYERALHHFRKLENDKSRGKYLIDFANTVRADSLYSLSLTAYDHIISEYPKSPHLLSAYLGSARANVALAQKNDDQAHARQAIDIIHQVQQKYPRHAQVADLSLLEAEIQRQYFFDIDRALAIYEDILKNYRKNTRVSEKALYAIGECYLIRGELNKSMSYLQRVQSQGARPQAQFLLARIAFYESDFDKAAELSGSILKQTGLSSTITNDVLDLQNLLNFVQTAPEALKEYAAADLLLFQGKKSEAISKLQAAMENGPPPFFLIRLIFQAAHLSAELQRYPEALAYCNRALTEKSLALYADEALFTMAGIVDTRLKDLARAYQLYDRLLVEFPQSQFVSKARNRLKEIRQQNPELVQ